jgi:hypothetical protein
LPTYSPSRRRYARRLLKSLFARKGQSKMMHINYVPVLKSVPLKSAPEIYLVQGKAAAGQLAVFGSEPRETSYSDPEGHDSRGASDRLSGLSANRLGRPRRVAHAGTGVEAAGAERRDRCGGCGEAGRARDGR